MTSQTLRWMSAALCVALAGCAATPVRQFFSRKAEPVSSEQEYASRLLADAQRLDDRGDVSGAARLRELARAATEQAVETPDELDSVATNQSGVVTATDSPDISVSRVDSKTKPQSAGGLFDVSSQPRTGVELLEAPPPKRNVHERSTAGSKMTFDDLIPPASLIPPTGVREQSPFTQADEIDSYDSSGFNGAEGTAEIGDATVDRTAFGRGAVTTAEFTESQQSSGIELAGNQVVRDFEQAAAGPWSRLRQAVQPRRRGGESSSAEADRLPIIEPRETRSPAKHLDSVDPRSVRRDLPSQIIDGANPVRPGLVMPAGGPIRSSDPIQLGPIEQISNTVTLPPDRSGDFSGSAASDMSRPAPQGLLPAMTTNANAGAVFNPNVTPIAGFNAAGAGIGPSLPVSPELERLIAQTAAEVTAMLPGTTDIERQMYLRKHVQLRLLFWIAGQTDRALQPIPGIDPANQEFWQQMLWGMANYFDWQGMPDSSERATQTIAQLKAAALRLQENAKLELKNVAFCHKIASFGNYQRFKRDEFTPGQPVLLYAEVCNFKSEPTSDGQFRTLMKSTVEILEGVDRGCVIETIPFPPSEDRCRNHRHDYFHSYEFAIPTELSSGPHVLRVTVEDQLGRKSATTTLTFSVQ